MRFICIFYLLPNMWAIFIHDWMHKFFFSLTFFFDITVLVYSDCTSCLKYWHFAWKLEHFVCQKMMKPEASEWRLVTEFNWVWFPNFTARWAINEIFAFFSMIFRHMYMIWYGPIQTTATLDQWRCVVLTKLQRRTRQRKAYQRLTEVTCCNCNSNEVIWRVLN